MKEENLTFKLNLDSIAGNFTYIIAYRMKKMVEIAKW